MLEMSGSVQAFKEGFRCVRSGAEVSLLGIPHTEIALEWAEQVIFKGLTIHGINGRRMFDTWYQCESFLRRQPKLIEPLITHRLPFDRFEEGINGMQNGTACKVVLDWEDATA
jgi:threonine 3-dehydrogenase